MAFLSSLFSYVYNEEPASAPEPAPAEEASKDETPVEEESTGESKQEEEEPEEPEDVHPVLREQCAESKACASFNKHFQHCTEKVTEGHGYKGEDCVEELFHLMHCVDDCVAPKLFSKLK